MSPTFHRLMLYACATVLLLALHTTHNYVTAAPVTWSDNSASDKLGEDRSSYFNALLTLLDKFRQAKVKRTRADAGFFSRHDAMSDYLQSAYANEMASDPYGPGKK